MFIKSVLSVLGMTIVLGSAAAAEYRFASADQWQNPELLTQKGDHLIVKGKQTLISGRLIPVKKGETLEILGDYQAVEGTPMDSVYLGFKVYDRNRNEFFLKNISAAPGSDTVLAKAAKRGDKVLMVRDGSKWLKNRIVLFNTKPDLSDLPNHNIIGYASKVEKAGDMWKISLQRPLQRDLAAGTNMRQHTFGATMSMFPAIYITIPKFSNPRNNNVKKMWDHVHFVRFAIQANWRGKAGAQLQMKSPGFKVNPAPAK